MPLTESTSVSQQKRLCITSAFLIALGVEMEQQEVHELKGNRVSVVLLFFLLEKKFNF